MYVLDEATLAGNKAAAERQLLAVWHDPDGRVVRSCRMSPVEVDENTAVLNSGSIDDFPTWMDAEIGDDYNWDGVRGPPPIEDEDEEEEEGRGRGRERGMKDLQCWYYGGYRQKLSQCV